jgi:hypothetical protein
MVSRGIPGVAPQGLQVIMALACSLSLSLARGYTFIGCADVRVLPVLVQYVLERGHTLPRRHPFGQDRQ